MIFRVSTGLFLRGAARASGIAAPVPISAFIFHRALNILPLFPQQQQQQRQQQRQQSSPLHGRQPHVLWPLQVTTGVNHEHTTPRWGRYSTHGSSRGLKDDSPWEDSLNKEDIYQDFESEDDLNRSDHMQMAWMTLKELADDWICYWQDPWATPQRDDPNLYILRPPLRLTRGFIAHNGKFEGRTDDDDDDDDGHQCKSRAESDPSRSSSLSWTLSKSDLKFLLRLGEHSKHTIVHIGDRLGTPWIPCIFPLKDKTPLKHDHETDLEPFSDQTFYDAIGLHPRLQQIVRNQDRMVDDYAKKHEEEEDFGGRLRYNVKVMSDKADIGRFFYEEIFAFDEDGFEYGTYDDRDELIKNSEFMQVNRHYLAMLEVFTSEFSSAKAFMLGSGACNPFPLFVVGKTKAGNIGGIMSTMVGTEDIN